MTLNPTFHSMASTQIQGSPTEEQAGRIDLFVRTMIDLSRSKLDALFASGCVSLNQKACITPATRVSAGDTVVVNYDPHQGYSVKKRPWNDRAFTILHEDDHLLVVNKSAAVLTIPTNKNEPNTLLDRISAYFDIRKKNHTAGLIHRLDRDVSGVMVFAKTPAAAKHLRDQFNDDTPQRILIAIVKGVIEEDSGTLESYLATHNNLNRYSTTDHAEGQHAITQYTVLRRLSDLTVLRLALTTARRHQARVQLSEFGHKILGDRRYGADESNHERWKKKRLAMHATSLRFVHPDSGETVCFNCVLPASMKKITGKID